MFLLYHNFWKCKILKLKPYEIGPVFSLGVRKFFIGAAETIDRIVDAFPTNQQAQVRTQLAAGLQAVISQILLPRLDANGNVSGRVAAFEIMTTTDAIRSRIRDNKTNMIKSDMQTGAKFGMTTLDASLTNLYKQGLIAYEELITKSQDPDSVVAKLKEEMGR